jgi:hypothetical protein
MPQKPNVDPAELESQLQVTCRHLRSKGMYITGSRLPMLEDAEVGDGNCWCNRTQHVLGPDDGLVERERCAPARTCFERLV